MVSEERPRQVRVKVSFGSNILQQVFKLAYLSLQATYDDKMEAEIKKRSATAYNCYFRTRNLISSKFRITVNDTGPVYRE